MFVFVSISICLVCASVRLLISSSVASADSSIKFGLNCLAVALVCLFSVLMFAHVFVAAVYFTIHELRGRTLLYFSGRIVPYPFFHLDQS
jgi:hypothetical protein